VALDLGFTAPDPQRPWHLGVRIPLLSPNSKNGLCTNAEAAALNAYEDALAAAFATDCGAVQVARRTWNGARELLFYGRTADRLGEALAAAASSATGYKNAARKLNDPEWKEFFKLYPTDRDRQWMHDRRTTEELRKGGDLLDSPRPVDHLAWFKDEKSREEFIAEAKNLSFEIVLDVPTRGQGPGELGVKVVREDNVKLDHIHEVAMQVSDLAKRFGGRYDRWGCVMVPSTASRGLERGSR
jgi:hypothetical protein